MSHPALDAVPEERGFRFQHGALARSLPEFRDVLANAPAGVVSYHRGHFAAWVRDVLRDEPLARRLEHYATEAPDADVYRETVLELVARRCAELAARA